MLCQYSFCKQAIEPGTTQELIDVAEGHILCPSCGLPHLVPEEDQKQVTVHILEKLQELENRLAQLELPNKIGG